MLRRICNYQHVIISRTKKTLLNTNWRLNENMKCGDAMNFHQVVKIIAPNVLTYKVATWVSLDTRTIKCRYVECYYMQSRDIECGEIPIVKVIYVRNVVTNKITIWSVMTYQNINGFISHDTSCHDFLCHYISKNDFLSSHFMSRLYTLPFFISCLYKVVKIVHKMSRHIKSWCHTSLNIWWKNVENELKTTNHTVTTPKCNCETLKV